MIFVYILLFDIRMNRCFYLCQKVPEACRFLKIVKTCDFVLSSYLFSSDFCHHELIIDPYA